MKTVITPGSIVSGESGKTFLVDRVEGDIIYSGKVKFLASTVLKVIPPRQKAFKLGDRVQYIGTHPSFQKQYGGMLTIWELGKCCDSDKCACQTPCGKVSTWIEYSALQLVSAIEVTPSVTGAESDVWA